MLQPSYSITKIVVRSHGIFRFSPIRVIIDGIQKLKTFSYNIPVAPLFMFYLLVRHGVVKWDILLPIHELMYERGSRPVPGCDPLHLSSWVACPISQTMAICFCNYIINHRSTAVLWQYEMQIGHISVCSTNHPNASIVPLLAESSNMRMASLKTGRQAINQAVTPM